MKDLNILMVGVGGQGVILASDVLAEIGLTCGLDVKKSDSIGISQRGGSVVSHIRLGEKVFSPLIKSGEADFLIAFEELEAARSAAYLKDGGIAIVADVVLVPLTAQTGSVPYPGWETSRSILAQTSRKVYLVSAMSICKELDNPMALNMVLLGFLSAFMEVEASRWHEIIRGKLPPRFAHSSITAFSRGAAEAGNIMRITREVKKDA